MNREQLFEQIKAKKSFLCVGLDTDINKIPVDIRKETSPDLGSAIFEFNKRIIDATAEYAVAYKPNLAFYEVVSMAGLVKTCEYIKEKYPKILIIADAKRGDIGNTSKLYARAFFENSSTPFDAVTLSPYMGSDSVDPFLKYEDKWAIVLALTSNESADDFETLKLASGDSLWKQVLRKIIMRGTTDNPLWKEVLRKAKTWGTPDNTMFVVGATRAETLKEVREIVPDHFLLVPGVGAQGGSLEEVAKHGMNDHCGLLVNSSRGIIYAGEKDPRWNTEPGFFAAAAAEAAAREADKMNALMTEYLK